MGRGAEAHNSRHNRPLTEAERCRQAKVKPWAFRREIEQAMREARGENEPPYESWPLVTITGTVADEPQYSKREILGEMVMIFPLVERVDRGELGEELVTHKVVATGVVMNRVEEGCEEGFIGKDREVVVTGRESVIYGRPERVSVYATSITESDRGLEPPPIGSQLWWEQEQERLFAQKLAESKGTETQRGPQTAEATLTFGAPSNEARTSLQQEHEPEPNTSSVSFVDDDGTVTALDDLKNSERDEPDHDYGHEL